MHLPMADSVSSKHSWHAIFAFLVPTIAMVVDMHFPDSSPVDQHPAKMWIFIVCLLLYCFSSAYYFKCQISASTDAPYFKLSSNIAVVSGSMGCAVLLSVLVSDSLLPLIIIMYLMFLVMYFVPHQVMQTCKNIGAYVHSKWEGTESQDGPPIRIEV